MIEQNIADHLRNPTTGDTSSTVRQAARERFRHLAGRVYLGRLPEEAVPIGVSVRTVSGGELYWVAAEYELAQPVVEFLIAGRDWEHGPKVLEVAESLRLIFSGYRGGLGTNECCGCTVLRSASFAPTRLGDGSDRWAHQFSIDFQFTIGQSVA